MKEKLQELGIMIQCFQKLYLWKPHKINKIKHCIHPTRRLCDVCLKVLASKNGYLSREKERERDRAGCYLEMDCGTRDSATGVSVCTSA